MRDDFNGNVSDCISALARRVEALEAAQRPAVIENGIATQCAQWRERAERAEARVASLEREVAEEQRAAEVAEAGRYRLIVEIAATRRWQMLRFDASSRASREIWSWSS